MQAGFRGWPYGCETRFIYSTRQMENTTRFDAREHHAPLQPSKRILWSAVFAGVLVAIVSQILLTLLGVGIGLGTIDATE